MVGTDPSFWRTVAGLPRPQDRKNVRRLPATVIEVAGSPPSQTARVLLPGEEATERPFFPVRGAVSVGERVWVEINASGLIVIGNTGGGGPLPTKRAAYTFGGTMGQSVAGDFPNGTLNLRLPFRLQVGTKRFRVKLANREVRDNVAVAGAVTLESAWIGEHALDANSGWTGNLVAGTQFKFQEQVSLGSAGAGFVGGWEAAASRQLKANTPYVLSLGLTYGANQLLATAAAQSFTNTAAAGGAAVAGALTPSLAKTSPTPFAVLLEYEFEGENPVVLFVGDSISDANATKNGVATGYHNQWARATGAVAIVAAAAGGRAETLKNDGYFWDRFGFSDYPVPPDGGLTLLGANDLGLNPKQPVTTVIADIEAIHGRMRTIGIQNRFHGRIMPREGSDNWVSPGTDETKRGQVNNALARDLNKGAVASIAFDTTVEDPLNPAKLRDGFMGGTTAAPDKLHPGTAGHSVMAAAFILGSLGALTVAGGTAAPSGGTGPHAHDEYLTPDEADLLYAPIDSAGGGGGASVADAQIGKIYRSAFAIFTQSITQVNYQPAVTPNVAVPVPALGAPPPGYAWRLKLSGAFRFISSSGRAMLVAAGFNGATSTTVVGGGNVAAGVQEVLVLSLVDMVPPSTSAAFTVDFTLWASASGGTVEFRPGPYPVVEAYLVAA